MPRVRIQCHLPPEIALAILRRANRAGIKKAGAFISELCNAYVAFIDRRGEDEIGGDIEAEVRGMFEEYTEAQGTDYGTIPVRHSNRGI